MSFELLPIIDKMLDFYQNPRNSDRFQVYLKMLQGDTKGDLVLPIGGFNPMAKEHILEKLEELKALNTEGVMQKVIVDFNKKQAKTSSKYNRPGGLPGFQ